MDEHIKALLRELGEDPQREGLRDTPKRTAKALKFLTQGYNQKLEDIVGKAIFTTKNDEMVIVRDIELYSIIELYSMCEHHMLPFIGRAHVAYLPDRKVIGLSKIPRIVDMYARRLQIQENLTRQIADSVLKMTGAKGVGVVIEAKHLCMMMRGVEKQNSSMTTSAMLGRFRQDSRTRTEFLTLIRG
jgi:GTP cyclohydrolase IA